MEHWIIRPSVIAARAVRLPLLLVVIGAVLLAAALVVAAGPAHAGVSPLAAPKLPGAIASVGSSGFAALVGDQTDGTWQTADEVPGTATLNTGGGTISERRGSEVASLSCAAVSNCSAGGTYTIPFGAYYINQPFVVTEA